MSVEIALHAIRLFDDVAGNHPFCDLVTVRVGIEEYLSAELFEDILYAGSCDLRDIFDIHIGKPVQTCRQCHMYVLGFFDLLGLERDRMVENIGLEPFSVYISLQPENLIAPGIHLDQIDIAGSIQLSVAFRKVIVEPAEHFTQGRICFVTVCFVVVEVVIRVPQFDVHGCLHPLLFG